MRFFHLSCLATKLMTLSVVIRGIIFGKQHILKKGRKKLHISVEPCVGITYLPGKCNVLSCRCDSPVDCRRHSLSYEKTVSIRIRSHLCWHYLSSRQVTLQVLSPQMSLTSVFGMGTGGPSSQSIPTRMDGFPHRLCQNPRPGFNCFCLTPRSFQNSRNITLA